MNRRQFGQTVGAAAAALALGETPSHGSGSTASAAALPADPLPPGAAARLGCNRLWHQWPASNPGLNDLTFSPDGRYLATLGYQDDHVFIWSIPDGRAVCDWEPQAVDRGGSLLWTPLGLYIASNGGLSLWEPLTASLIHRFADTPMDGVAVSADGRLLAATTYVRSSVEIWDTTTWQVGFQLFAEIDGKRLSPQNFSGQWGDFLLSTSFSGCGRWLAAGGYRHADGIEGCVHCWHLGGRRHMVRFGTKGAPIGRIAFTPTGRLLTADWSGTVSLWEVPEGRLVRDWPRPATGNVFRSMAVNASGQIAVQREDGVRLWNPDPGQERLLCPALGYPHLAYSDDGRFVAVGAGNGRVSLYDVNTGIDRSPPDRHDSHVDRIEVSADGTVCVAYLGRYAPTYVNEVVLRDIRTGAQIEATAPKGFWPLALSPVGTRIAGRLSESRLAVWDWSSGDLKILAGLNPQAVAWRPDGHTLVILADNNEVTSWCPATGREQRESISCSATIIAVAVSAQGRAAALSNKGDLFVWQMGSNEAPHRLTVPLQTTPRDHLIRPLVISPDGRSAAATFGDGIVYFGELDGDELRAVYTHPPAEEEGDDGRTVILHFTDSGRLLIAGTCTTLRENKWWYTGVVTDGLSGVEQWRSLPQRMWANALALCPDGQTLLTGNEDGTVLVWPLGHPGA